MSEENIVIEVDNATKVYQTYKQPSDALVETFFFMKRSEEMIALNDVSLEISKGEILGVVGSNESGKSTLASLINGTTLPTNGTVRVAGKVVLLNENTDVAVVNNGIEYIRSKCLNNGVTKEKLNSCYEEVIQFLEVDENQLKQSIQKFDKSLRLKLAISVALFSNVKIIILDKVLELVDLPFKNRCLDKMLLLKESGVTFMYISDDVKELNNVCTRAIWLDKGLKIADGDTKRITALYNKYFEGEITIDNAIALLNEPEIEPVQQEELANNIDDMIMELDDTQVDITTDNLLEKTLDINIDEEIEFEEERKSSVQPGLDTENLFNEIQKLNTEIENNNTVSQNTDELDIKLFEELEVAEQHYEDNPTQELDNNIELIDDMTWNLDEEPTIVVDSDNYDFNDEEEDFPNYNSEAEKHPEITTVEQLNATHTASFVMEDFMDNEQDNNFENQEIQTQMDEDIDSNNNPITMQLDLDEISQDDLSRNDNPITMQLDLDEVGQEEYVTPSVAMMFDQPENEINEEVQDNSTGAKLETELEQMLGELEKEQNKDSNILENNNLDLDENETILMEDTSAPTITLAKEIDLSPELQDSMEAIHPSDEQSSTLQQQLADQEVDEDTNDLNTIPVFIQANNEDETQVEEMPVKEEPQNQNKQESNEKLDTLISEYELKLQELEALKNKYEVSINNNSIENKNNTQTNEQDLVQQQILQAAIQQQQQIPIYQQQYQAVPQQYNTNQMPEQYYQAPVNGQIPVMPAPQYQHVVQPQQYNVNQAQEQVYQAPVNTNVMPVQYPNNQQQQYNTISTQEQNYQAPVNSNTAQENSYQPQANIHATNQAQNNHETNSEQEPVSTNYQANVPIEHAEVPIQRVPAWNPEKQKTNTDQTESELLHVNEKIKQEHSDGLIDELDKLQQQDLKAQQLKQDPTIDIPLETIEQLTQNISVPQDANEIKNLNEQINVDHKREQEEQYLRKLEELNALKSSMEEESRREQIKAQEQTAPNHIRSQLDFGDGN